MCESTLTIYEATGEIMHYGCLNFGSIVVMGMGLVSNINTALGPVLPPHLMRDAVLFIL